MSGRGKKRDRCFAIDVPGGGTARVHGDPKMDAKSRAALGNVLRAAYEHLKTPEGKRMLAKLKRRRAAERAAERDRPKTMRLPENER